MMEKDFLHPKGESLQALLDGNKQEEKPPQEKWDKKHLGKGARVEKGQLAGDRPGHSPCGYLGTCERVSTFGVVAQTLDSKPLLEGPAEQIHLLLIVPHLDHPADTPDRDEGLVRVAGDGINGIPGLHKELLEFGAICRHVVHGSIKRSNNKIPVCQGETRQDQRLQGMATPTILLLTAHEPPLSSIIW